jgi:hypothetical protein
MSTKAEALVEYLAGGEGAESERVRAEAGDPSGEYALFLAGVRQLSRAALGEEVLRRVSLFAGSAPGAFPAGQDLPDVPPERAAALPAPGTGFSRLWSAVRAVPWVVSAVSCVFVVLLWYENREQRHRVEVTRTVIERHLVEVGKAPPAGPVERGSGPSPALPGGKPGADGQALPKARAEDAKGLAEEVRKALDEALNGRASREDLTGLEQRLDKRLARVEALLTALVRRPAGAPPQDPDKRIRAIVAEELALLRKQVRADVSSLLRSWRGPGGKPAAGPPRAGGPGKGRPVPPRSAGASHPPAR